MFDSFVAFITDHPKAVGEVLGFIAGMIVLAAALPSLWVQLKSPRAGTRDERLGHIWLAAGNALLALACALTGTISVMVMATINTFLRTIIWLRMICSTEK